MKPQEAVKTRKNYTLEYRQSCVERAQGLENPGQEKIDYLFTAFLKWVCAHLYAPFKKLVKGVTYAVIH